MFKIFVKIAWSSLSRRKNRSIMVIAMIAICFWGILVMEGFYDGMTEQVIDNAIRSSSGHITIYAKDYRLDKGLDKLIEKSDDIITELAQSANIKSYNQRVIQDCLVATAHYSQNGVVMGIDLDAEKNHARLDEYLVEGNFSFGKRGKGILLGAKLAQKLKAGVGKKIILSAQDKNSEISAIALKVTGILRTNNMSIDERAVFIDLSQARHFLQVEQGASQISIIVKDQQELETTLSTLQAHHPGLDILSWDVLYPALLQSRNIMKIFNLVTSLIVFLIAGLGIFGVMLVSVLERMREFGIMLAVGTQHLQIFLLVIIEAFCMSMLGYLIGGVLGGATLAYYINHGLDLTIFSEGLDAFGLDTVIYAMVRPEYFITAFLAIFFASFCSILYPLWVLRRSRPIESITRN